MSDGPSGSPNIARPDVSTVLIVAGWEQAPWPDGLLSDTCYASMDGDTVLRYAQWRDDRLARERPLDGWPPGAREIERAAPGSMIAGPAEYRRYRGDITADPSQVPGCIVIAQLEFDDPDEQRQRAWVDATFDAGGAEIGPIPGYISAHFHLSTDGTRVLNYAEWTDAEAHRAFFEGAPDEAEASDAVQKVHTWPGIVGGGVNRYRIVRAFADTLAGRVEKHRRVGPHAR